MSRILDIVICTYEREDCLFRCLASLGDQSHRTSNWGIIIVNNSHRPFTDVVMSRLIATSYITSVHEPTPGLSLARNKGIKVSSASWLAFLDDDAEVPHDYVERIFDLIQLDIYDCFGGHIVSTWPYGRPRWLSKDFGSKPSLGKSHTLLQRDQYNWGSNIVIKRAVLVEINGFPEYIGMKGQKLGYAAENIVQDELRTRGWRIGYAPDIVIRHAVLQDKLRLMWHLESAFATGRDGRSVYPLQYGWRGMMRSLKNGFSGPFKALWTMIWHKDFYWENLVLDSLRPWYLFAGKVRSFLP